MEARNRFDKDSIEYLALYDGFPASDSGCVAPEFSVERISENIAEEGRQHVKLKLVKLIIRNENNEALKTAE